jgi:uncharacterized membrane protein
MVTSTTPRPARERLLFLDAVRGWALILMILNHTGRWWQEYLLFAAAFPHALLVLLLVAMGRGWQEAKRWYREHGPALGVLGRA